MGLGLFAIGWLLIVLRAAVPAVIGIAVAHALLIAGLCCQYAALLEFGGRRVPGWLVPAPATLLFLALLPLLDRYAGMTLLTSIVHSVAFVALAGILVRLGDRAGPVRWLSASILIAAAVAVKLSGPGPVFFRQQRLGQDARPFMIFKFRTMHMAQTDHVADKLTEKNDPRVTRIGAFLRKSSIDELPQLFNVLKGDMSIVGPRPHAPAAKAADTLYWEVDERYWARHCIKPGMTGLAQVRGHRGPTDRHEDLINRLQSDLEYVTNWSIWRDLRIIVATLGVLSHDNAF